MSSSRHCLSFNPTNCDSRSHGKQVGVSLIADSQANHFVSSITQSGKQISKRLRRRNVVHRISAHTED
jgi:hypothetical protein